MKIHGYKEPKVCRIKKGLSGEGATGVCFGYLNLKRCWAIVQWDKETYPTTVVASTLELQEIAWADME